MLVAFCWRRLDAHLFGGCGVLWWSAACARYAACARSDEVAWLRARVAELEDANARLRQAAAARDELAAAQLAARDAQIAALAAQVEELRRRLDKDSSHVVEAAVIGQPV